MVTATKPKRVRKGLPKGILAHRTGKYQARICKQGENGKPRQIDRPLPGLYITVDAAVEAQQAAQQSYDAGLPVWSGEEKPRNSRGQARAPQPHHSSALHIACAFLAPGFLTASRVWLRDQNGWPISQMEKRNGIVVHPSQRNQRASVVASTRVIMESLSPNQQACHCPVMLLTSQMLLCRFYHICTPPEPEFCASPLGMLVFSSHIIIPYLFSSRRYLMMAELSLLPNAPPNSQSYIMLGVCVLLAFLVICGLWNPSPL